MQEIMISNGTRRWVDFIKQRIRNNKNFMGVFIGQTGSGKSYSALELADLLHDRHLPTENICFKASQFLKRLDEGLQDGTLKKGDVLIWDETGIDLNAKDWQSRTSKIISRVMQTFRTENIIVLFTVPYLDFVSKDSRKLIHAYFQTMKIVRKRNVVLVKPYNIQTNQVTGKMYRKSLKVRQGSNGIIKVKTISLSIPRRELVNFYEETASKFKRDIIKESRAEFDKMDADKQAKLSTNFNRNLTIRQAQVYTLWSNGMNQKEIAEKMNITPQAVGNFLRLIGKKIDFGIENEGFQIKKVEPSQQPT